MTNEAINFGDYRKARIAEIQAEMRRDHNTSLEELRRQQEAQHDHDALHRFENEGGRTAPITDVEILRAVDCAFDGLPLLPDAEDSPEAQAKRMKVLKDGEFGFNQFDTEESRAAKLAVAQSVQASVSELGPLGSAHDVAKLPAYQPAGLVLASRAAAVDPRIPTEPYPGERDQDFILRVFNAKEAAGITGSNNPTSEQQGLELEHMDEVLCLPPVLPAEDGTARGFLAKQGIGGRDLAALELTDEQAAVIAKKQSRDQAIERQMEIVRLEGELRATPMARAYRAWATATSDKKRSRARSRLRRAQRQQMQKTFKKSPELARRPALMRKLARDIVRNQTKDAD